MKEEIDISEAREIWNSPSPQMDKDQIDRAYESIGGYILRSRISKGIKGLTCKVPCLSYPKIL